MESQSVGYAAGVALGQAAIFLPIAYFAGRRHLGLRPGLGQAWTPFAVSWLALLILALLGVQGDSDSALGLVTFFVLPIVVCGAALWLTYRVRK
jgi:hypothetical protein